MCYRPYTGDREGVCLGIFHSFIISVLARVVAYCLCQWCDGAD